MCRRVHAHATQDLDGVVTVNLGSKGVIELELVSTVKMGRGPPRTFTRRSRRCRQPSLALVKALNTLVSDDGNEITIDNYSKRGH